MKTFWALATVITTIILSINTIATAQGQNSPQALMQAAPGWPNQADEPLKRGARQIGYGGGGELEAWACGVLCPDDGAGFIPYRAPRPTKGIFIGIRG